MKKEFEREFPGRDLLRFAIAGTGAAGFVAALLTAAIVAGISAVAIQIDRRGAGHHRRLLSSSWKSATV
ncbi:hypothetical protein [Bradyrhizobium sp. NP1]|uniref:hypothetical protein n=1 Tax=Bradyrhizobium sp. NP1 TaxID=3049772 RepID=UPI0025A53661|nr:hypothetical protein [Bradyrhizobium sp. NP1]WJR80301.1 hypothetical protein QOU61_11255 [Bradyrhizobium sp. NP1]